MSKGALPYAIGIAASVALIVASLQELPVELSTLEAVAVVSYAWSVWLLAKNNPLGWWIGLFGVTLYAIVFYQVRLFAEVAIQVVYFATSLQAIYIWLRGGIGGAERPVSRAGRTVLLASAIAIPMAVAGLQFVLIWLRGAAPFWDALTTVLSLTAHLYLMWRYVESWYLWVAVDIVYVPLYASRELYVTAGLYAIFLVMATYGMIHFHRLYAEQQRASRAT